MSAPSTPTRPGEPPRLGRASSLMWVIAVVFAAFFVVGVVHSEATPSRFANSIPSVFAFVGDAFPPDLSRIGPLLEATLTTFEMAVVGTAVGATLSLPLAIMAARNTSPHPVVYQVARALVSFLRSVPELVWGLIFVVAVGLGPFAGILAIAVDMMGFCGRFYAERIEEIEPGAVDALEATGASRPAVIAGAIVPTALPSFIATTMFGLESATRAAVILGLVGAGGIGIELNVAMQLFQYQQALTIILVIFAVVVGVERTSAAIRRRLI